jgi:hypothetical protein
MMSEPEFAKVYDAQTAHRPHGNPPARPRPIACIIVFALTLLARGFSSSSSASVQADDSPPSGLKGRALSASGPSNFVSALRRTLKSQHDRMTTLANQLIKDADMPSPAEAWLAAQPLKIESAEASLRSAELAREAAEIALAEFEKGRVPEETHAKEVLKVAQKHLQRLRRRAPQSKERRARIKQASKDSSIDIAPLVTAELEEKKALLDVESAESALKVLVNTTNPERLDHLRSDVDRGTSAGMAARTECQRERTVLARLQQMSKMHDVAANEKKAPNPHDRQALANLERAIAVEAQLRRKVEQLTKDEKPDDPLRQQIQDLTTQLQSLVDQAEIERSATRFDELKKQVFQAASR